MFSTVSSSSHSSLSGFLPTAFAGKYQDEDSGSPRPDPDRHASATSPPCILIVEDDFFIATDVETSLKNAGYDVCGIAPSADEAVALAKVHKPALAIMDIRLIGQRDGIDAAMTLRKDLGLRCIFASAHADEGTKKRAEAAEPLGWLAKPYSMSSLIHLVQTSLAQLRGN